jgi:hypothetical protein
MVQIQYDWLNTADTRPGAVAPPTVNQFYIRRANLTAISDLGNGWSGELGFNFAAGAQRSAPPENKPTQANFRKAIVAKTFDGLGTVTAGYQKVNWGQEENTSSSKLKPIERSVMSFYFDGSYGGPRTGRLGFGGHHVGVYWDGTVAGWTGFYYGAALTNGIQSVLEFGNSPQGRAAFNQFGYWTNVGYRGVYHGIGYRVGVNFGYGSDANSTSGSSTFQSQNNAIYGYNPYLRFTYGDFTLDGEFMQAGVENGRIDAAGVTSDASPYAFLVQPSYLLSPQWEVVGRFSYLATNGRGTQINPVIRNAQNTFNARGYDDAWGIYAGFNYYIIGNAVELSAGYEFTEFLHCEPSTGAPFTGASAYVNGVRTQMQVMF